MGVQVDGVCVVFRVQHPGVLEKVKLRAQRPVWHDKLVDFLVTPSWIKLGHGVSQACWNAPEFGPNALRFFRVGKVSCYLFWLGRAIAYQLCIGGRVINLHGCNYCWNAYYEGRAALVDMVGSAEHTA